MAMGAAMTDAVQSIISLNFTERGIREIKDDHKRAQPLVQINRILRFNKSSLARVWSFDAAGNSLPSE